MKIFQPRDYKGNNLVNDKQLTKELTDLKGELTDKIDDVNSALDTKIDDTKEELEGELNSAKGELEEKIDEVDERLDGKIDTTQQTLEEKINTEKQALETKIDQTKQKLEGDLNSAKEELGQQIQTTEETLRGELQTAKGELDSKIDTAKTELKNNIDSAKQDLEAQISEAESTLNGTIESTKSGLETKIDEAKEEFKSEIKSAKDTLQEAIDTKADNNTVTTLSQRVDTLSQEKADVTALEAAKTELQKSIGENTTKIEAANELIQSTTTRIEGELETLGGRVAVNETNITALQEQSKTFATSETVSALSAKVDGLEESKVDSDDYNSKVAEIEGEIEKRVTTENFEQKLTEYTTTENLNTLLDGKADDSDITTLDSKIDSTKQDILGEVDKSLEDFTRKDTFESKVEELNTSISTAQTAADKANNDLTEHAKNTTLHPTTEKQTEWDAKVDTTTLQNTKQEITDAYNAAIKEAVGTVFNWKGSVQTEDDLADKEADVKIGDVWNVRDTNANYVWSGPKGDKSGGWDKLSENLEGLATTESLKKHMEDAHAHFTGEEKSTFNSTLQSNTSAIASINSAILGHTTKIEKLQEADETINETLNTKADKTDLKALETKVDGDITNLNTHTTNTNIHFTDDGEKTTWKADIDNTKSGLATLEGEFETHAENTKLHFANEEKDEWRKEIDQAKTDITQLQADVKTKADNTTVTALQQTVSEEQTKLSSHIADTNAHFDEGEKNTWSTKLDTHEQSISTLSSELADTKNKYEQLDLKVTGIDTTVQGHTTTIASIQETLGEKADQTALQGHIDNNTVHFENDEKTEWKQQIDKSTQDLKTLTSTVTGHGASIERLQAKDTELDTAIKKNASNITELQSDVETLQGQVVTVDKIWSEETSPESENAQSGTAVKGAIDEALKSYTDTTNLELKLADKADKSALEEHTGNTSIHFSEDEKKQWETKIDTTAQSLETVTEQVSSHSNSIELLQQEDTKLDTAIKANTQSITELNDNLQQYLTIENATTTYATKNEVNQLTEEVGQKASQENLDALEQRVEEKADKNYVDDKFTKYTTTTDLDVKLNAKADTTEVDRKLEDYVQESEFNMHTQLWESEKQQLESEISEFNNQLTEIQESIPQVDSKYNGLSENAQSGTAVFGALESLKETITGETDDKLANKADKAQITEVNVSIESAKQEASSALDTAKTEITAAYKQAINDAVGSVFTWKGTVDDISGLTSKESEAKVGDVWNVKKTGANYVWKGKDSPAGTTGDPDGWDKLSESLEGFATTESLTTHTSDNGSNGVHFGSGEKASWNTQITNATTQISTLNDQVSHNSNSIEQLQVKDQELEKKIDDKLQDALTSTSITKVLVYTDASKAPELSKREAGVLYLIAEASS